MNRDELKIDKDMFKVEVLEKVETPTWGLFLGEIGVALAVGIGVATFIIT